MAKNIVRVLHDGELNFGEITISCAVLEDGQRVLVQRSTANALGARGSGAYWKEKREKGAQLPEYLSARQLQPYITEEMYAKLSKSVTYINRWGEKAEALPAENLADICDIWVRADQNGALNKNQKNAAKIAYIILKGLATVGIVALVDEATGYQDIRAKNALAQLLEQYLAKELQKWVKTFPNEYYKEMFKLRKWKYNENSTKRAPLVGKLTNNIIYDRLAPSIREELEKLNPKTGANRKHKHHQYLSDNFGHPKLREHIASVTTLMKVAGNWTDFIKLLDMALPKYPKYPTLFDETDN